MIKDYAEIKKAICFDIGGTLLENKNNNSLIEKLINICEGCEYSEIVFAAKESFMKSKTSLVVASKYFCEFLHLDETIYIKVYETLKNHRSESIIFVEVLEVLKFLKARGYILLAISNNYFWNTNQVFNNNLSEYFDYVLYSYECNSVKPDKKIFKEMEYLTELRSKEILLVGDSWTSDVVGAKKAGWDIIYINRDLHHKCMIHEKSVLVISNLKELYNYL